MNILGAMAGICDGNFTKIFTNQNVDIITLGGFSCDIPTYKASCMIKNQGRREFTIKPCDLNKFIQDNVKIIQDFNSEWMGKIMVNIRGCMPESFKLLKNNSSIDILEVNAHCRQKPVRCANAGQSLVENLEVFEEIICEVSSHENYETSVKLRANVENVDILEVIDIINNYPVKYIHVDAMKPGIMDADYDIIREISENTHKHIIANNSVTTHENYQKMLEHGAESVSVARAALSGDITHIFK